MASPVIYIDKTEKSCALTIGYDGSLRSPIMSGARRKRSREGYFVDSARRNVHKSAFIKDPGISGDTEEIPYEIY